mgnify:CR=1 FL=1
MVSVSLSARSRRDNLHSSPKPRSPRSPPVDARLDDDPPSTRTFIHNTINHPTGCSTPPPFDRFLTPIMAADRWLVHHRATTSPTGEVQANDPVPGWAQDEVQIRINCTQSIGPTCESFLLTHHHRAPQKRKSGEQQKDGSNATPRESSMVDSKAFAHTQRPPSACEAGCSALEMQPQKKRKRNQRPTQPMSQPILHWLQSKLTHKGTQWKTPLSSTKPQAILTTTRLKERMRPHGHRSKSEIHNSHHTPTTQTAKPTPTSSTEDEISHADPTNPTPLN